MVNGSIITNSGKVIILDRAYNDDGSTTYTAPSEFKIGIEQTTPAITDTDLDKPVPISGTELVDDCEATTGWVAGTDTAIAVNGSIKKIGSYSLDIEKDGATGTVFSAAKTTTSRDYTAKDLHIWVYLTALTDLVATGTAMVIKFGSASGDNYQFDIDISALSAGWNLIIKASGDADSTNGTPVIAACDYTYVGFNTDLAADTVASGRIVIDDIKLASSGDYTGTYLANYPSVDETNHQVETRFEVTTTQANGYDINSAAMFNTDGTVLMHSMDAFAGESKTDTDEFLFIITDRIIDNG